MNITHIKGDLFNHIDNYHQTNNLIIHICNNVGKWGKGFVLAISNKWKSPEAEYRNLYSYKLGTTQFITVANNISVGNMIAQKGINTGFNRSICRVDYEALRSCLKESNIFAMEYKCTIHMPMIGAGLAGGDWNIIYQIIKDTFDSSIDIRIYSLT